MLKHGCGEECSERESAFKCIESGEETSTNNPGSKLQFGPNKCVRVNVWPV